MSNPNVTPEALAFCNQAFKTIVYLASRWEDEKEYENINLYLQPLSKIAEKAGVQLRVMTKKPFGVKFAVGPKLFHVFVKKSSYAYKRIA